MILFIYYHFLGRQNKTSGPQKGHIPQNQHEVRKLLAKNQRENIFEQDNQQ